jgi:hypothetical protein
LPIPAIPAPEAVPFAKPGIEVRLPSQDRATFENLERFLHEHFVVIASLPEVLSPPHPVCRDQLQHTAFDRVHGGV